MYKSHTLFVPFVFPQHPKQFWIEGKCVYTWWRDAEGGGWVVGVAARGGEDTSTCHGTAHRIGLPQVRTSQDVIITDLKCSFNGNDSMVSYSRDDNDFMFSKNRLVFE